MARQWTANHPRARAEPGSASYVPLHVEQKRTSCRSPGARYESITLLGTTLHRMRMADVLAACSESIRLRRPILIGVANVAKLVKARRDPHLRQSRAEATFTVADGVPVVWLSRLCGCPLPARVAGIDIMNELLAAADREKYGVSFLGARQEIVERVVAHVRRAYPGVRIAGYRNGYFSHAQEADVAAAIGASAADILLVAVPTPQKEDFLRRWREDVRVPVCHGVGGSFDVVAGITRRAPRWMQRAGLEWLYRVRQEPRRMWKRYLITNTTFIGLAVKELVRARFRLLRGYLRHVGGNVVKGP
ncbi:MAG: WecB/TagA/CpsF family glycosyltransferase [Planctomycetes bacterium]|nr:WecB/TagA/CpsF family glycosyltransferase [Planctomycetota bacterium]